MAPDRKRFLWILILIGMFFANLIVITLLVFNQMTASPKPADPQPATAPVQAAP